MVSNVVDNYLYLKIDDCVLIDNRTVFIKDIAQIECADKEKKTKVQNTQVHVFENDCTRCVLTAIDIISTIHNVFPDIKINNIGETDTIVELNTKTHKNKLIDVIKVMVVCLIVFFGSAFTIMSFHEDIGITDLFENIYSWIYGKKKADFPIIEVTYSIGLALGIFIFYNKIGNGRKSSDPSPLEMEMKSYETTINDTIIMKADRNDSD